MHSEAEALINRYKQTRPVDIQNLILNLGLGFEEADLGDKISGHIKKEADGYVIRVNSREHVYRRRFTAAHELGHYMLHRSILDEAGGVNDSTMYRTDIHAPVYNSHIHTIHEQQANSFAANLLMPEDLVREVHMKESVESSTYDGTPALAPIYRAFHVSPSAMRWRLKNLELNFGEPVAA